MSHARDRAFRANGAKRPERAVLIAGPTASGKSALALALAQRLDGVVVNADSMQVYRDLRTITARPSPEEEAGAPHRLYGHVDAAENYSVGRWLADMAPALDEIAAAGQTAIVVGGTGLYFKALTRGLAAVPPVPPEVRNAVRERAERIGIAALHAELAQRDPAVAARVTPADRVRIARALEVLEATGRSITEWHGDGMAPLLGEPEAKIFLNPDRATLYGRIDARFDLMLKGGALDEVRALDARGLDPLLPCMKAHGVPWLRRHLRGEIGLEEAADGGKRDTRHYAKRQNTWFRHQLSDWPWAAPEEGETAVLAQLEAVRP